MQELRAKPITVMTRLVEMEEAFELDILRLQELDEMIKEAKVEQNKDITL